MKLVHCNSCGDTFNLSQKVEKKCSCGETKGRMIDDRNAVYSGNATAFGISDSSFHNAVKAQANRDLNGLSVYEGSTFDAYIYPEKTATVIKQVPDLTKR